jgi:hypothetical protein
LAGANPSCRQSFAGRFTRAVEPVVLRKHSDSWRHFRLWVVKRGAVVLAAAIVPVYAEACRRWTFNSWGRFFLPKPFPAVTIRFGDPITAVSAGIDGQCRRLMRPTLV